MERPPAKLLDRVRNRIRVKGYSIRTEQSYASWIRRFILFHNKRHPQDMGKGEIEAYLTHLAVTRHVSPSTQNQAFNALLFLYRKDLVASTCPMLWQKNTKTPTWNLPGSMCFQLKRFPLIQEGAV